MKATTPPPAAPLARAKDAVGRTPPWAWRLAAMVAGMVAAALVGKAVKAGKGRMRSRSALVRWPAALALTAVAAIAAAKSRNLAEEAVTRAWNERQPDAEPSAAGWPAAGATSSSNGRNR